MLRVYRAFEKDDIFGLHDVVKHLVCEVWCKADEYDYTTKLSPELKRYAEAYPWVNEGVKNIYSECKTPKLTSDQRKVISEAFVTNNKIEELCNGLKPVPLNVLPDVVAKYMQPLLERFYKELLDRKIVGGDKLKYYKRLQDENQFNECPCCGYMPFSSGDIGSREDYDHYLPKSKYPFASVNFKNLVPLCDKCNCDTKGANDPIENNRLAFYPFRTNEIVINIQTKLANTLTAKMYDVLVNGKEEKWPDVKDITITVSGAENDQVKTWNEVFDIQNRYADRTKQHTFIWLKRLKDLHRSNREKEGKSTMTFKESLLETKENYKPDYFTEQNFLKIPFIQAVIETPALVNI